MRLSIIALLFHFVKAQHGFRSGRSCCTQLLEVIQDWADAIEDRKPVDMIYLDYRKAFDSVPFERLLVKLYAYRIRGKLLQWIREFLTNRKQKLSVNNHSSIIVPEKDLGITFDRTLHFTEHIEKCSSKANQRIGLIRRNFKYMDEKLFIVLYKALIRPLLEYGNVVWKPYFKKDSELLERVQRRATRR